MLILRIYTLLQTIKIAIHRVSRDARNDMKLVQCTYGCFSR
jgi:regulator of extracellular matrix RemA (YlzA/DUF370 family)